MVGAVAFQDVSLQELSMCSPQQASRCPRSICNQRTESKLADAVKDLHPQFLGRDSFSVASEQHIST